MLPLLKMSRKGSSLTVGTSFTYWKAIGKQEKPIKPKIILTFCASDLESIYNAISEAQKVTDKPTIIKLRTTIGYGSKQQGTHGVHGSRTSLNITLHRLSPKFALCSSALKADDISNLKSKFGFDTKASFNVPEDVYSVYHEVASRGAEEEKKWEALLAEYVQKFPEEGSELKRRISGELPSGMLDTCNTVQVGLTNSEIRLGEQTSCIQGRRPCACVTKILRNSAPVHF